jgi:hypothetical protein
VEAVTGPRKQRTRQHVIADQSVNYVERFVIDEGHVAQRVERDYGYDLFLTTFDEEGFIEAGYALLQLKASETLEEVKGAYPFDLDIRDYNLWLIEPMPVILVLFDASRRRAYWLHAEAYFLDGPLNGPRKGQRPCASTCPTASLSIAGPLRASGRPNYRI